MVHKALDIAKPGDIVVVDCSGAMSNAVLGDLVANKSIHRKIGGYVIDGLIRDLDGIKETGLPVYARGVTPLARFIAAPGKLIPPFVAAVWWSIRAISSRRTPLELLLYRGALPMKSSSACKRAKPVSPNMLQA